LRVWQVVQEQVYQHSFLFGLVTGVPKQASGMSFDLRILKGSHDGSHRGSFGPPRSGSAALRSGPW